LQDPFFQLQRLRMNVDSENFRGAWLMVCSMVLYTLNDACLKSVGAELPVFQSIFIRSILVAIFFLLVVWFTGAFKSSIPSKDIKLLVLRAIAEIVSTFFFISALFKMPIANVVSIVQILPLTVSLGAVFFLRERIGWRRVMAIVVGFIGVLLIVRPGAGDFNFYSIYALLAVFFVTLRELVTRRLSKEVSSIYVATTTAVSVFIFSAMGSLTITWVAIDPMQLLKLITASIFLTGGYLCAVLAIRNGDIGFVAPFRYTSLIAALILGLVFFGEWPDTLTIFGALTIFIAGMFSLLREKKVRLQKSNG